jgi:hypothetical protein
MYFAFEALAQVGITQFGGTCVIWSSGLQDPATPVATSPSPALLCHGAFRVEVLLVLCPGLARRVLQ